MDQRISFITLGARNLQNLKAFYMEKFGWTPMLDRDGVVFYKMNGIVLCLFPGTELAADSNSDYNEMPPFKGFSLSINYRSEKEVDDTFARLREQGVEVIKAPEKVFWGGYSGYVKDIENNIWEIAFNPFLHMDENGNVISHDE